MILKYLVLAGIIILIVGALKFAWQEIKRDPIANLVVPATTALLTSLLLCLLEMRR